MQANKLRIPRSGTKSGRKKKKLTLNSKKEFKNPSPHPRKSRENPLKQNLNFRDGKNEIVRGEDLECGSRYGDGGGGRGGDLRMDLQRKGGLGDDSGGMRFVGLKEGDCEMGGVANGMKKKPVKIYKPLDSIQTVNHEVDLYSNTSQFKSSYTSSGTLGFDQRSLEQHLKERLMSKTECLSNSYQNLKTFKVATGHSNGFEDFANMNGGNDLFTRVAQYDKKMNQESGNINNENGKKDENKYNNMEYDQKESEKTSQMDSYRIYPSVDKVSDLNSTDSVRFKSLRSAGINPFDTLDSKIDDKVLQKMISSDYQAVSSKDLRSFKTAGDFFGSKKTHHQRKSILKNRMSKSMKPKKKVKFANLTVVKKLRPEEIIQTPLSLVEGLYMPTEFFFQVSNPLRQSRVNFNSLKVSIRKGKFKKSRKKYSNSGQSGVMDYTNKRDYSTRNGGYNNLVKMRESSQNPGSASRSMGSYAKSISPQKEREERFKCNKRINASKKYLMGHIRQMRTSKSMKHNYSNKDVSNSSDKGIENDSKSVNRGGIRPGRHKRNKSIEEEIQLIEHDSVVFNFVDNRSSLMKSSQVRKSVNNIRINKKSNAFSSKSSTAKKLRRSRPEERETFNNFLSCLDIDDSDLKRSSAFKSFSRNKDAMSIGILGVSEFGKKIDLKAIRLESSKIESKEKERLSEPVQKIISKIAKFKKEHYKSKSKMETPKFHDLISKKGKETANFKSSISPIRKKVKKMKIMSIRMSKGKGRSLDHNKLTKIADGHNTSKKPKKKLRKFGTKSKSKKFLNKTYKEFRPMKRVSTYKNLSRNSNSPKSIVNQLKS